MNGTIIKYSDLYDEDGKYNWKVTELFTVRYAEEVTIYLRASNIFRDKHCREHIGGYEETLIDLGDSDKKINRKLAWSLSKLNSEVYFIYGRGE